MHEVSCFHLMLIACVIYGNIGVIESVSMLPVIDSMYCDSSAWLFRGVEMAWYQRASAIWSFRRWTNYYKRFRAAYTRWHAIWLCSRVFQLRATLSRLSTDYQRPRDRSVHEEEDTEMCNISMSTLWGPQLLLRQWKQPFFLHFLLRWGLLTTVRFTSRPEHTILYLQYNFRKKFMLCYKLHFRTHSVSRPAFSPRLKKNMPAAFALRLQCTTLIITLLYSGSLLR